MIEVYTILFSMYRQALFGGSANFFQKKSEYGLGVNRGTAVFRVKNAQLIIYQNEQTQVKTDRSLLFEPIDGGMLGSPGTKGLF